MLLLFRPTLFPVFVDKNEAIKARGVKKRRILRARLDDKVPLVVDPDVSSAVARMMKRFSGAIEKAKFELVRKREEDDREIQAILELLWD